MSGPAPALKVALFGTPSNFTTQVLRQLAAPGIVATVVLAQRPGGVRDAMMRFAGITRISPLERAAQERRIPVIAATASNDSALVDRLLSIRPDLICIAMFPRRVPREITTLAPFGAINVHPSLLPRHRGPLPLFWTYHADDQVTGVTVHHTTEKFDAGDIILQESFPLPRAYSVVKLDQDVAMYSARMLKSAVEVLARGQAARIAQDESVATYAPLVRPGTRMVRFDTWDVERVWHFLAALSPRYREPLSDNEGRPVSYREVAGFERTRCGAPGTVEKVNRGWKLNCRGGVVLLRKTT